MDLANLFLSKMFRINNNVMLLIGSFCFVLNVSATKYFVNDNLTAQDFCSVAGNDANSGTSSSQPKRSLRAIWTAYSGSFTSGDTIFIDAGTYARGGTDALTTESKFDIVTAGLVIQGRGTNLTVFDNNFYGTNTDYFIWIKASNVTLRDFTVTNYEGGAPNSGGTYSTVNNGAQAVSIGGSGTISNVLIENLNIYDNGGSGNAALTVSQNTQAVIKGGGSTCNASGSVYSGGIDVRGNNVDLLITNYVLAFNQKSGFDGGGLYVFGDNTTNVKVYNSTISDNRGGQGGGAGIYLNGGVVTVRNSVIKNNLVSTSGGPYRVGSGIGIVSGTMTLAKSTIQNNTVAGASTADFGGVGIYPMNGNITLAIDSCYFLTNSGARSTGRDLGARIHSTNLFSITVNECTFSSTNPIDIGGGSTNSCTGSSFLIKRSGNPGITYSGSPSCLLSGGSNTLAPTQLYTPTPASFTGVCGSITILPVELMDFSGVCEETHAKLQWSTASEHNNDYFTIEHAGDNGQFMELAHLNGQLNSTSLTSYVFNDYSAVPGLNYYRLSQTDVDGKIRTLKTIAVDNTCLKGEGVEVSVSFNQSENTLNIGYLVEDNQVVHVELYNTMGQLVQQSSVDLYAADRKVVLQLIESFTFGMYFVKLSNENFSVSSKVLISK